MKRTWFQLAVGCFPVLMGFCSRLLFLLPFSIFIKTLLITVLWLWLCFRAADADGPGFPQTLRLCLPGILITGLALWSERIPGNLFYDFLSSASDFYFSFGLAVAGRIVTNLLHAVTAWPYYLVSCFLLTPAVSLTVLLKRKRT